MYFITILPKYEEKSVIMIVVDQMTRYAHFFSLFHPFKESTEAEAFMQTIE